MEDLPFQELEELALRQLRKLASDYDISRYSRMRKEQLIAELQRIREGQLPLSLSNQMDGQEAVEAAKFDVGQDDRGAFLSAVDQGLPNLPSGYGESRIVLMPRDPQWAYTYWDVPNEHKEDLRRQGGKQLALRLYDVTDINLSYQSPNSIQEYPSDELAREWYMPIPVSDRDYVIDIGYRCADGRWLVLARSAPVRVPPVYPSDWIEDQFITLTWGEDLRGRTLFNLGSPRHRCITANQQINLTETQHVAGSLFGSIQMVPEQAISSYVFPSGIGMWSGVGMMMSGIGMSGIGFSASMPPLRPRKFWLVADAELIVYGATEPDAKVTIGGCPIQLNADGTFRFQMSFPDGLIDFPIMAVASDGEQSRSIHMKFTRETLDRDTNTKQEAVKEIRLPEGWETIKEIKEQVLQEYEKLQRLKHLNKEKWALEGFDEEELMELQRDHENFISQKEVGNLLSPAIEDFQRQASKGNPPTTSEIADVVIPLLLEAAADGVILIPQNPKLEKVFANLINLINLFLYGLEDEKEERKNSSTPEKLGKDDNEPAGIERFVPPQILPKKNIKAL